MIPSGLAILNESIMTVEDNTAAAEKERSLAKRCCCMKE
jgi:hypothetical protein